MKFLLRLLMGFFLTTACLSAGELIIYGGAQKPGAFGWANTSPFSVAEELIGDFGSTFGIRYSAGRVVGFEQSIGYSPRFAKSGVRAFQMDSNLVIQAPGNIVPYGTVVMGYIRSWGQDFPGTYDPKEIAAFVFSMGNNFAINYGGGLKVRRLWGPLGINIDVRGYALPSVKAEFDGQPVTDKGLRFVQTTAGMVFTW